jgi:hypothetical protein
MLAGYEDPNDHDTLRANPAFRLVADRSPDDTALVSRTTLSRFEKAISAQSLQRLRDVFLDQFYTSFDAPRHRRARPASLATVRCLAIPGDC